MFSCNFTARWILHTMLGGHVFTKRPCARLNKHLAHVRWHRPASTQTGTCPYAHWPSTRVNAHARVPPETHRHANWAHDLGTALGPRLALQSALAPLLAQLLLAAAEPTFWTHFQQSPRHAPSATGPASGLFPLEEMAASPPITAPAAATSPIARQEGEAGLPAAEKASLRPGGVARRWCSRAQSQQPRSFRPPESRCGRRAKLGCDTLGLGWCAYLFCGSATSARECA